MSYISTNTTRANHYRIHSVFKTQVVYCKAITNISLMILCYFHVDILTMS